MIIEVTSRGVESRYGCECSQKVFHSRSRTRGRSMSCGTHPPLGGYSSLCLTRYCCMWSHKGFQLRTSGWFTCLYFFRAVGVLVSSAGRGGSTESSGGWREMTMGSLLLSGGASHDLIYERVPSPLSLKSDAAWRICCCQPIVSMSSVAKAWPLGNLQRNASLILL